ncbi:MAG: insulinase family protein, partial [Pseudomonadales bacterium]|nr:insulinase family protein [Pseudomonadales bacterium]
MTFSFIRKQKIESLNVDIEEYCHEKTGARHLHIAAENPENVFLVAFRTVPKDSSGVAHILEHTVLCGSEKYPVRDPFFMMIRRSLNTFMNAFTSSDWTAYPFASKNRKDFDNLLEVYLDSVFFSRIDPLDFAQEGHRVEFETVDDPASPLVYKGVVYNEMKGAMSSPTSLLWQALTKYIFPSTTYHHNSGGEPDHIPDLSYDQLQAFYRKHYHPSNAVFMTYGDIPAQEHHDRLEMLALSRFSHQLIDTRIPDEKRYYAPVRVQEAYPIPENEPDSGKTHIVTGWLLGHSFNLEENLEAHLLANVLFENSASPLLKALETTHLGHSPSPLCGLEDSNREMTFVCGIEGSEPDRVQEFEALILDTLNAVAENGVEQERLEAVLHQLELSQREISGDSYPYGLQLILSALSPMIHGGDPIELLDLDPVLVGLREKIADPEYIKGLVKKLLIDNPHRVTLLMSPDKQLESRRDEARAQTLASIKKSLSESESKAIIEQAQALSHRQLQKDDDSVLPKVTVEDVPLHLQIPEGDVKQSIAVYEQGTNGLVYEQIIVPLPVLTDQEKDILAIYSYCLTELGCGDKNYLDMQDWQSAVTGGVSAYTSVKGRIDDVQATTGSLVLSGKALARNYQALGDLMHAVMNDVRFEEKERIRELVAQIRSKREQAVTSNGHALAMGLACSQFSPASALAFRLAGLQGIQAIKILDDALQDSVEMDKLADMLSKLHDKIRSMPRKYLIVSESEYAPLCRADIEARVIESEASAESLKLQAVREHTKAGWLTSTQVNFCSKAYQTVPVEHEDSAALTVLGNFLRNGYLHRAIREQGGAYGGGAGQDSSIAAFRFYSYRDPRL